MLAHARTKKQRSRIIHALLNDHRQGSERRAEKLAGCCSQPAFYRREDGMPALSMQRCRDRACPLCAGIRGKQACEKVAALAKRMSSPRLITLTLTSSDEALSSQIDRLFLCFRDLRRTVLWKKHVKGGVFTLEVTFNADRSRWHPHLHILVDGDFFPQPLLRSAWEQITGDSFIVDVRAVYNRDNAANYIASYVAKPIDAHGWTDETICTFLHECKGRRFIGTFGKCHTTKISGDDDTPQPKIEKIICDAWEARLLCDAEDEDALFAVDVFSRISWSFSTAMGVPWDRQRADQYPPSPDDQRAALQRLEAAIARFRGPPQVPPALRTAVNAPSLFPSGGFSMRPH